MPASLDFTHYQSTSAVHRQHNEALINPHGFELAILTIANGVAEYALSYRRRHGEFVGRNSMSASGLESILKGLLSLMCGDVGRLDVRRIDAVVSRFAKRHKLKFGE